MPSPHTTGAEPPSRGQGDAAPDEPEETTGPGARRRPAAGPESGDEQDIVEVAGEGSFPGSDPPSWSQALAR